MIPVEFIQVNQNRGSSFTINNLFIYCEGDSGLTRNSAAAAIKTAITRTWETVRFCCKWVPKAVVICDLALLVVCLVRGKSYPFKAMRVRLALWQVLKG